MSQQRHTLGRTILSLNTSDLADVWSLQEEVSRLFQQQAAPEIERLFDRLVDADEVVRLDQVEIDIGAINPHDLTNEFTRKVLAELDRALSDRISSLQRQPPLTRTAMASEEPLEYIQNRTTADWEICLYFLQYGRFPWWSPQQDWPDWIPRWEAALQQTTNWRSPLQTLLAASSTARQRFVLQLPAGFRQQCLLQLQPGWIEWPSRLTQAQRLMQSLGLSQRVRTDLETQAWEYLLANIHPGLSDGSPLPAAAWARRWLTHLVQTWRSHLSPSVTPSPQHPLESPPEATLTEERGPARGSPTPSGAELSFEQMAAQRLRSAINRLPPHEQALWFEAMPPELAVPSSHPTFPTAEVSPAGDAAPARPAAPPASEDISSAPEGTPAQDWEVLLSVLQYGRFPRGCSQEDWPSWISRWDAALQQTPDWRLPLQTLLAANPIARQRFVLQLPAEFRLQCLLQLQPGWIEWPSRLAQARQLMQGLELSPPAQAELETQAWGLLLAAIQPGLSVESPLPAATWASHWLAQLSQAWRSHLSSPAIASPQSPDSPPEASQAEASVPGFESESTPPLPGAEPSFEQMAAQRLRLVIDTLAPNHQPLWFQALPPELASLVSRPSAPTAPVSADDAAPSGETDILAPLESEGGSPTPEASPAQPADAFDSAEALAMEFGDSAASRFSQAGTDQTPAIPETISNRSPADDLAAPVASNQAGEVGEATGTPDQIVASRAANAADRASANDLVAPAASSDAVDAEEASLTPDQRGGEGPVDEASPPQAAMTSELSPEVIAFLTGGQTQPTPPTDRSALSPEEERAGLYITQAGLVLLHPFIQTYLDAVGLLVEDAFRDRQTQQQALYLLHYLATGQTAAPEPELVLPKLLCGWPLNDPVAPDPDLPDATLAEGEALLQTVIGHWQALKNTSPDGLREGFLQREGKLTCTDNGWKLRVEQKAIDVLLSRLPWGISMVTLPWMDGLLAVEWS